MMMHGLANIKFGEMILQRNVRSWSWGSVEYLTLKVKVVSSFGTWLTLSQLTLLNMPRD